MATLDAGCRERLGSHHLTAVQMGNGRGQVCYAAVGIAAHPELAHRHICRGTDLHSVEGTLVGLGQELHTVLVAEFTEVLVVVLGHEFADGKAQVPEETFGHFRAVHVVASHRGQVAGEVIVTPCRKLLLEAFGPVAAAYLVAVYERAGEGCADQRSELVDDGLYAALPEGVERLATHLVALQSVASGQRRMVGHAGGRIAEAQDGPAAFGDVPCERAAGQHLVRQVDDGIAPDNSLPVHVALLGHQVCAVVIVCKCLLVQAVDALVALRSRKGKDGDVAVELVS